MTTDLLTAPPAGRDGGDGLLPARADRSLDLRQPVRNPVTLRKVLEAKRADFESLLPARLTPDRLIRVALTAVNKTPALLNCSFESVLESLMTAAQLGLEPGGPLGGAYLVPFKGRCQLVPGYRGLIDLARRSGEILTIEARTVGVNDAFEVEYGDTPRLYHKPDLDEPVTTAEQLRYVYAVAQLRGGGRQFEVMTRKQVDAIRAASQGRDHAPWSNHYPEMARKTVVRRLVKYLPVSSELQDALSLDEAAAGVVPTAGPGGVAALSAKLTSRPVSEGQTFEPYDGAVDPETGEEQEAAE